MSPRLTSAFAWTCLVLFVASNILDAIPNLDYTPNPYIGPAFIAASGAAFADRGIRRAIQAFGNGKNGKEKEPDE